MAQLTTQLQQIALEYRTAQFGFANSHYKQQMPQVYELIKSSAKINDYLPILRELLAAQERHDYLAIADSLQFELVPLLLLEGH